MPKVKCITVLLIIAISVVALSLSAAAADDDWTWHNHGEYQAFASGKDLSFVFSGQNLTYNPVTEIKKYDAKFYAIDAEFVSFNSLTSFTSVDDNGATTTYTKGWSQTINLPQGFTLAMGNGYYLNPATGKEENLRTSIVRVNPDVLKNINEPEDEDDKALEELLGPYAFDPNGDPTEIVENFVNGMMLGVSYDEIKGIEAHIGVQSGKTEVSDGFESGYLIKKNTVVRVD